MRALSLTLAPVLTLALTLSAGAVSARSFEAIKASGTLRVGTPGDYAPFSLRGPDGKYHGADITEITHIAKKLGLKLEIVQTSWKTLEADTRADKFDVAVGGISITDARKAFADFTIPLVVDGKRPIVRCADKEKYSSLGAIDAPGVRVVVNPGGTNDAFAKANLTHADVTVFPDNTKIFDQIAEKKQDVMVTDGVEVDHQALLHPGVLCAADVPAPFTTGSLGYLLQQDPALKTAVDGVIKKDIASGRWKKTLIHAEKQP